MSILGRNGRSGKSDTTEDFRSWPLSSPFDAASISAPNDEYEMRRFLWLMASPRDRVDYGRVTVNLADEQATESSHRSRNFITRPM